jgi:hypothetical protein
MPAINSELQKTAEKRSVMDPRLGHVRGRVTDMDGHGLGHSRIWVRETGQNTLSDAQGSFVLINVLPAVYSLIAESEGYSQATLIDVPVFNGNNPGCNFILFPTYNRRRIVRGRQTVFVCEQNSISHFQDLQSPIAQ